jgi:hypothetical protein
MTDFDAPVRVFTCPHCKETINTSMDRCRFCSAPVDRAAAEGAADLMERVNQACSDASFLRIMAGMLLVFLLLAFVPLIGAVGGVGYLFLLLAVPVMAIRWFLKFGGIKTEETDFRKAQRAVAAALGIWSVFALVRIWIFLP